MATGWGGDGSIVTLLELDDPLLTSLWFVYVVLSEPSVYGEV